MIDFNLKYWIIVIFQGYIQLVNLNICIYLVILWILFKFRKIWFLKIYQWLVNIADQYLAKIANFKDAAIIKDIEF